MKKGKNHPICKNGTLFIELIMEIINHATINLKPYVNCPSVKQKH